MIKLKKIIDKITVIRAVLTALIISVMVLIFAMSAQSGNDSGNMSGGLTENILAVFGIGRDDMSEETFIKIEAFVRKLAHFSEYALLGGLSTALLLTYKLKRRWAMCFSVTFSMLYAATDEIHQLFVPGRGAQISDVCIDTGGALCGALLCLLLLAAISAWKAKHKKIKKQRRI